MSATRTISVASAATAILMISSAVLLLVASADNALQSLCPLTVDTTQITPQTFDYLVKNFEDVNATADRIQLSSPPGAIQRVCYNNGTGRPWPNGVAWDWGEFSATTPHYTMPDAPLSYFTGEISIMIGKNVSQDNLSLDSSGHVEEWVAWEKRLNYLGPGIENSHYEWRYSPWGVVDPSNASNLLLAAAALEGTVVLCSVGGAVASVPLPPLVIVLLSGSAITAAILCLASSAVATHMILQLQPGFEFSGSHIIVPYLASPSFLGVTWLTSVFAMVAAFLGTVTAVRHDWKTRRAQNIVKTLSSEDSKN